MNTKREIDLKIAVTLIKATKGKRNTAFLLREVFDEVNKIRTKPEIG